MGKHEDRPPPHYERKGGHRIPKELIDQIKAAPKPRKLSQEELEEFEEWDRLRHQPLLDRRVPYDEVEPGRLYVLFARNASVGIARVIEGQLGYLIRRNKMGAIFLCGETDWDEPPDEDGYKGTAIPLRLVEDEPSPPIPKFGEDEEEVLAWLAVREARHGEEAHVAWQEVVGDVKPFRQTGCVPEAGEDDAD